MFRFDKANVHTVFVDEESFFTIFTYVAAMTAVRKRYKAKGCVIVGLFIVFAARNLFLNRISNPTMVCHLLALEHMETIINGGVVLVFYVQVPLVCATVSQQ